MPDQGSEKAKEGRDTFIESIGEDPESIRKALSDKRLQDAFIDVIRQDPELIEVLSKVTPNTRNLAADWSCCRGYRPKQELLDIAESMKRRLKEGGG